MALFLPAWLANRPLALLPAGGRRIFSGRGIAALRATLALQVDSLPLNLSDPNVPRVDALGFMAIEGARTNWVTNPRYEGGAAGNPSGAAFSATNGVAITGRALRNEGGVPVYDVRLAGTATAAGIFTYTIEGGNTPVALNQVVTTRFNCAIKEGAALLPSLPSGTLYMTQYDSGGAQLTQTSTPWVPSVGVALKDSRAVYQRAASQAGVSFVRSFWRYRYAAGEVVNTLLSFAQPDIGVTSYLDSTPLPPVGAPAVSARAEDRVTAPVPAGAGAAAIRCYAPQIPAAGEGNLILLQVDDGTDANRLVIWIEPDGVMNAFAVVAGAFNYIGLGTVVAGEVLDLLIRYNAEGAAFYRGAATAGVYAGPMPAALNTARVGNRADWFQGGPVRLATLDTYPDGSVTPGEAMAALARS